MSFKKILVIANFTKAETFSVVEELKNWAEERKISVLVHKATAEENLDLAKESGGGVLAITLGGDGTFLKGARLLSPYDIPILGVNLGSLGFLTQVTTSDLTLALEQILAHKFKMEPRMRLECRLKHQRFSALNEVLISRTDIDKFMELELWADQEFIGFYPGDGLIVSTPTGSTAYSLAAGGPIIDPAMEAILVTPLMTHKLGLRSVIFPPNKILKIKTHTEAAVLSDGDKVAQLPSGDKLEVRKSELVTKMIITEPRPAFFTLLEKKLNWGRNPQRKST